MLSTQGSEIPVMASPTPHLPALLGHYRIAEKIGEGAMGEVYRAHDERLHRDVAIKVLPVGALADETARKRFRNEALALSRLNHPNIETIFDFDSEDGVEFIATEYIAGEGLDTTLASGALSEKDIALFGSQLAEGVAAAHQQGIIHRDLKPSNLRITPDRRLKILDFGIADLTLPITSDGTTATLGESKRLAGTLPYMAPEQVRGEKLDARTDIWGLGAVLYEMATGRRPFRARALDVTDQILRDAPAVPSSLNPQISPTLDAAILKCLEKDAGHRYQSAKELLVDLQRVGRTGETAPLRTTGTKARRSPVLVVAAVCVLLIAAAIAFNFAGWRDRIAGSTHPSHIRSIAVLPLENLSGDPGEEYFVDGVHEELIVTLGMIRSLTVISRTSVMQYKSASKPLPKIAKDLGVDAVVEGSVRRDRDQVRITVQLIDGASDRNLWAGSYQREIRDSLALQGEVARAIAEGISIALTPEEETRLASAYRPNPEAHDAYLKGRYYWNKRTTADLEKAREYFQQALDLDPGYALGYAGLADTYLVAAARDFMLPEEAARKAEAAARRALVLDDRLSEAHTCLAGVSESKQEWSDADREYKRAIELNPSYATAHHWYSIYLAALGRREEAMAEIKRASELDPLSLIINDAVGWQFYLAGQYDEAISRYNKTLQVDPNFLPAYYDLGRAYLHKGMFEDAIRLHMKLDRDSHGHPTAKAELAHTYAVAGRRSDALKIVKALTRSSSKSYVSPYYIARIYAGLGDKNQAIHWLNKAVKEDGEAIMNLKADPDLQSLRSEPRFQELAHRLNFPQ